MSSQITLLFMFVLFTDALPPNRPLLFVDKTLPDTPTFLSDEDFKNAAQRREEESSGIYNTAMYNMDRFEGDIILDNHMNHLLASPQIGAHSTNAPIILKAAIRDERYRWPNATVPYVISSQFNANGRAVIAGAMEDYARQTCIRFVPKGDNDRDYINIQSLQGCFSYVGRTGGMQPVSLGKGCLYHHVAIHELMHALGFFHEQSRPDRDQYITVLLENAIKGSESQFKEEDSSVADTQGTTYDYGSVMHYDQYAFSKNNKPTMIPLQSGVTLGNKVGFSPTDLDEVNKLYNCRRNAPEVKEQHVINHEHKKA